MSGCYPNRLNTLLTFGLMSVLLEVGMDTPEQQQATIARYSLSVEAGKTPEQTLKRHIRNIRALEYTVALGDVTAKALGERERNEGIKRL